MKDDHKDNNVLPKIAVGAAVVGGVAAVAAVLNSDNGRKEVKKGLAKIGEKGEDLANDVKDKAVEVGSQAIALLVKEYEVLRQKLEDYLKSDKHQDEAKELQKSADEIAASIQKAKDEGEDVAQQLVEDIKSALSKLNHNLQKLEREKQGK